MKQVYVKSTITNDIDDAKWKFFFSSFLLSFGFVVSVGNKLDFSSSVEYFLTIKIRLLAVFPQFSNSSLWLKMG